MQEEKFFQKQNQRKKERPEQSQTVWIWNSLQVTKKDHYYIANNFPLDFRIFMYGCFCENKPIIKGEITQNEKRIFKIFSLAKQSKIVNLTFLSCSNIIILQQIQFVEFSSLQQLTIKDKNSTTPTLVQSLQFFQRCRFEQLKKVSLFIKIINISSLRKAYLPNLQQLSYGVEQTSANQIVQQEYIDIAQLSQFQFPKLKVLQFPNKKIISENFYAKLDCLKSAEIQSDLIPIAIREDYNKIKTYLGNRTLDHLVILHNMYSKKVKNDKQIGIVAHQKRNHRYNQNLNFMGQNRAFRIEDGRFLFEDQNRWLQVIERRRQQIMQRRRQQIMQQ